MKHDDRPMCSVCGDLLLSTIEIRDGRCDRCIRRDQNGS